MPSLSLIATEAQRLIRSLPEGRRLELQKELVALCEHHWQELRGPQPETAFGQALWSVTPPLSDLLLDLYAAGDSRLLPLMPGDRLSHALALLVLAEIARGNETGVHTAHEPMMAFEETPPPADWLARLVALLRGTIAPPQWHPHDCRDTLFHALTVITAHTRRLDLPALLQVIALLAANGEGAEKGQAGALKSLRQALDAIGIRFLGIDDDHIQYALHGHAHKPVRSRQLGEILLTIRQKWLR